MIDTLTQSTRANHLLNTTLSTLLGVGMAAFFGFLGDKGANDASLLTAAYHRIAVLEAANTLLVEEHGNSQKELTILLAQMHFGYTTDDVLEEVLEALDVPAWLKEHEPVNDDFPMRYINRSYETFYAISKARYIDALDSDVHPPELAQRFGENDRRIFECRCFEHVTELATNADGVTKLYHFFKFYLGLPDGREFVFGFQIDPDEYHQ